MRIPDSAASEVVARFEAEFGAENVRRWFGTSVQAFELRPTTPESVEVRGSVESFFDRIAPSYERNVANKSSDLALRNRSVEVLGRLFHPGDRVLEIGSGTGLETLELAKRGVRLMATDISGEMIRLLQSKLDSRHLGSFVETRHMAAKDVSLLVDECGPGSFDGAFSTFGALNCEKNLEMIPPALSALVRPDGAVMFGIWNRFCGAEFTLSLAAGNLSRAFARFRTPVPVGASRYGIPVYALPYRSFVRPFLPYFRVEKVVGVPVFVPPYDYDQLVSDHEEIRRILHGLDTRFADRFPFNRMGDHFFVEMRRR